MHRRFPLPARTLVIPGLLAILVLTGAESPDARAQETPEPDLASRLDGATEAALDWLLHHQEPDGSWAPDGFDARCEPNPCSGPVVTSEESQGPGHGRARHRVGITSLALLALLDRGWTHETPGRPGRAIERGTAWLLAEAGLTGSFGYVPEQAKPSGGGCHITIRWESTESSRLYDQILATLVLARRLDRTTDPRTRRVARRAVWHLLDCQDPRHGGWGYGPDGQVSNTSMTTLAIRSLVAAREAGLKVPAPHLRAAHRTLPRVTVGQEGLGVMEERPAGPGAASDAPAPGSHEQRGEVGYMAPGDGGTFIPPHDDLFVPLPALTARALVARDDLGAHPSSPVQRAGAQVLLDHLPRWSRESPSTVNFYYWWAGSQAAARLEGELLEAWRPAIAEALLDHQRGETCAAGSWDPVGDWCVAGGRVYATALGVLSLEAVAGE